MKLYLLISILFAVLTFQTSAQGDYLITIKGDTLYGEIKILGVSKPEQVQLIQGKKKQNFHPLQAREFSFEGNTYNSVKNYDTYQFMRLLQSGYLSLYAYRIDRQSNYDGRLLVRRDGSIMDVPNLGFKRKLIAFLNDCDEVSGKFEQQEVGRNDIEQIITFYNSCMDMKSGISNTVIANEELKPAINASKSLLEHIKSSNDFSGKTDAIAILEDIHAKLLRNENIPGYLQEALKASLKDNSEINSQLQELIDALKN
jgi:hypothetical protein